MAHHEPQGKRIRLNITLESTPVYWVVEVLIDYFPSGTLFLYNDELWMLYDALVAMYGKAVSMMNFTTINLERPQ